MDPLKHNYDEDFEPPCTCGSVAIGGMMGFFAGLTALLLFNSKLVLISSMSVTIPFGVLGSQINNPFSLNKELFMILAYLSFGLLAAVVYLIFDTFTMIDVLAIAFALSVLIYWSAPFFLKAIKNKASFNKYYSQKDGEE